MTEGSCQYSEWKEGEREREREREFDGWDVDRWLGWFDGLVPLAGWVDDDDDDDDDLGNRGRRRGYRMKREHGTVR